MTPAQQSQIKQATDRIAEMHKLGHHDGSILAGLRETSVPEGAIEAALFRVIEKDTADAIYDMRLKETEMPRARCWQCKGGRVPALFGLVIPCDACWPVMDGKAVTFEEWHSGDNKERDT